MEFSWTGDPEVFRAEVRDWLHDHLVGEFSLHRGVGGPADDQHWDLRLAWERELAAAQLLNASWPTEYGGAGASLAHELVFLQEHALAAAPYWVGVAGRDLFGPTLIHAGSDAQKKRFLPAILQTEEMWGQGFSEPGAGSDLASLRTRAVQDGDEWVINGQKIWTTFGARADWLYVLCRTDPDVPKHKGISMLIVKVDQPGVDVRPIRNIANGCEFSEVFLTDARTTSDLVVGPVHGGWSVAMGTVGVERLFTVLPYIYAFEREMDELIAFCRAHPQAAGRSMRREVAHLYAELQVIRYSTMRTTGQAMRTGTLGAESSLSKLQWSLWHQRLGELMMDAGGLGGQVVGPGYQIGPFQRTFLNSRAETIYGGTAEVQRSIIAERMLGLPRE